MKLPKFVGTLRDKAYNLLPYVAKGMGFTTIWTRKIVGWFMWIGLVALPFELIFWRSQVIPTFAAIAASMAFTEASKMRKSFKAWGFEDGPGKQ